MMSSIVLLFWIASVSVIDSTVRLLLSKLLISKTSDEVFEIKLLVVAEAVLDSFLDGADVFDDAREKNTFLALIYNCTT